MNNLNLLLILLAVFVLVGCGGSGGDSTGAGGAVSATTTGTQSDSDGQLTSALTTVEFNGNLILSIEAANPNGIAAVSLRFVDNGPLLQLCSSQSCGGNFYSETISGINPGEFGAVRGTVTVTLLVTDSEQQTQVVSVLEVDWQPPLIANVQATRSADGATIEVNWSINPVLLRYNVYIASQTGVNRQNFQFLPNGQAFLAVASSPQVFSNLQPNLDYFVLLTGIDGSGESTNLNEIRLVANVNGPAPNSIPIANADVAALDEDDTLLIDVLVNDTDADGDVLVITNVVATIGTATIQADQVLYEPPLNFNGNTTANYTISDNNGGTANAEVTIQVSAVNDVPEAADDFSNTLQNTAVNIDVLGNDSDVDGDVLIVDSVTGGQGTLTINQDNTINFDPATGFVGTDTFAYVVSDGNGGIAKADVFVEVNAPVPPNSDPVANDDTVTLDEDDSLLIDALANDNDADGDALTIINVTAVIGTATIQANQVFYEPPMNFNGGTSANYTVSDNNGGNDTAQINIQITPVNDAPEATNDFANTLQDTAVNIDVLNNDVDIDGDVLTVESATGGQGTLVINQDNTITFNPAAGFVGTDTFNYVVNDGNGATSNAVVTVDVGAQSRQPLANNDNYIVLANQAFNIDVSQGVLVNDADPDGDSITVIIAPVRDTVNGVLTLAADGSFGYQPNAGFVGNDSFEYQITDANGLTQSATANLDVRAIPADLSGGSTSISGAFLYIGLGESTAGSGLGRGNYRTGDCVQDDNTRCVTQGNYTESANSGNNPNQSGSYAFIQTYSGIGDSPVIAESRTPGSNIVSFTNLGDSVFELFLFPQSGGVLTSPFPDNEVFANSLFFEAFISNNQTCVGLPAGINCNIGQVGLFNGAQLTAPLDRLGFSQTGAALVDSANDSPQAIEDVFTTTRDTTLTIDAPGVLQNDTDPDIAAIGDGLQVLSQFSPGTGALTALGYDEYRQHIYTLNSQGRVIAINERLSAVIGNLPLPGELTSHVDIEIASEALQLAGVSIPQGTVLLINGETNTAEVFAVDPSNGVVIAQLNTNVGNGDVVGGAYNPRTQTLFLLQETQAGTGDPIISEINTSTGATLNQFSGAFTALDFDLGFGDIEVNNETGSLYIVGNAENSILELNSNGSLVRLIQIPQGVVNLSGMAVSQRGERIWLASNDGNVFELSFVNQGVLPQLQAELVVAAENGTLVTGRDGSFIYTPNAGFVGDDIFTYQVVDRNGKNSLTNVRITVTN